MNNGEVPHQNHYSPMPVPKNLNVLKEAEDINPRTPYGRWSLLKEMIDVGNQFNIPVVRILRSADKQPSRQIVVFHSQK